MLELVNKGLEEYRNTDRAMLVDVREKNEYARGHIPGAFNEPLSSIDRTTLSKDRPLFLYCLRGSRSKKAAGILKKAWIRTGEKHRRYSRVSWRSGAIKLQMKGKQWRDKRLLS